MQAGDEKLVYEIRVLVLNDWLLALLVACNSSSCCVWYWSKLKMSGTLGDLGTLGDFS